MFFLVTSKVIVRCKQTGFPKAHDAEAAQCFTFRAAGVEAGAARTCAQAVVSSFLTRSVWEWGSTSPCHREGKRILLRQLCWIFQTSVCIAGAVVGPPEDGVLVSLSICRCSLWLCPPSVTSAILLL